MLRDLRRLKNFKEFYHALLSVVAYAAILAARDVLFAKNGGILPILLTLVFCMQLKFFESKLPPNNKPPSGHHGYPPPPANMPTTHRPTVS